jgi:hypothetical protein
MQPLSPGPEPTSLLPITPFRVPSSFISTSTSTTAVHVPTSSSPGVNIDTPQARVEQQQPERGRSSGSSSARNVDGPRDTKFVHSGTSTAHAKPNITLGPKKNMPPSQSPPPAPPAPTTVASSPGSPTQAPAPDISPLPPLPDVRLIFINAYRLLADLMLSSCIFFGCAVIRFISHVHIYAYQRQAIPPTLREILHAYTLQDDARKHRGMLLDVLRAKSAEDQVGNHYYYLVLFRLEVFCAFIIVIFVSLPYPSTNYSGFASNPLRLPDAHADAIHNNMTASFWFSIQLMIAPYSTHVHLVVTLPAFHRQRPSLMLCIATHHTDDNNSE